MWDDLASQIAFECGQLRKLIDPYRPLLDRSARDEPDRIEAAAVGAMLHSFYGGVENIFKRITLAMDGQLPRGEAWHTQLLEAVASSGPRRGAVISPALMRRLKEYLAFRHVFRSVYAFLLTWDRMAPLAANCEETLRLLEQELEAFVKTLPEEK